MVIPFDKNMLLKPRLSTAVVTQDVQAIPLAMTLAVRAIVAAAILPVRFPLTLLVPI